MFRIAVVTPNPAADPTSAQILKVRHGSADLFPLASGSLRLECSAGLRVLLPDGQPLRCDALLLRRLSHSGSVTVQFDLLDLLGRQGALLVNSPAALLLAESKLTTTGALAMAGLPVPHTLATQDVDEALEVVRNWGGAVLKRLYGELGEGVERITPEISRPELSNWLDEEGALYLQEFVPTDGTDYRAFVVGDRVVAAMRRTAVPGQWKANIHLGGTGTPVNLEPNVERLAVQACQVIGLEYAGVDILMGPAGPLILEVNGAPGWLGLQSATGADVANTLVQHIVRLLEAQQGR